jgi:hypothetical protein
MLAPGRLARRLHSLVFAGGHRHRSTVIAGPEHLQYAGGLYHPGAAPSDPQRVVLLAKAQLCHGWEAVGSKADLALQGDPVILELGDDLSLQRSRPVTGLVGYPDLGRVGHADFRLFKRGNQIWVNHDMIPLVRRHPSTWTRRSARPCLSILDLDAARLIFRGEPELDFRIDERERNWVYSEIAGDLYLFYSFAPYRVLTMVDEADLKFATVIHSTLDATLADIGGYGTPVVFSTNPVEYDDQYLLAFVQQVEPVGVQPIHHHWAVLLRRETLVPHRRTAKPLISSNGARGRQPGLAQVTSVIRRKDAFVCFLGEGDAYVTRRSIRRDEIETQLVSIASR